MNKEVKDVLQMLVLVVPIMAGCYFAWLQTPMYKDIKEQMRMQTQLYLQQTYYSNIPGLNKDEMMRKYGLTDADINPLKMLEKAFNDE